MKKTKLFRLGMIVLTIFIAVSLVGCGSSNSETSTTENTNSETSNSEDSTAVAEKKMIAIVPPAMVSPYYAGVIDGAKAKAAELGYEIIILAPERESDAAGQVKIVEDLIISGIDGIALCAINSEAVVTAVKKANEANIPIVFFNSLIDLPDGDIYSYIGYIERNGGGRIADYLNDIKDGSANVAILEGLPSSYTTERKGGFEEALKKYPDIKVVASQPGDWEREKAMNVTLNMLQGNPEIDTIFALCDEMALGAVQAIKSIDKEGIKILSMDGNPNAIEAVSEGTLTSTLYIQPVLTGEIAVEQLEQAMSGQPAANNKIEIETIIIDENNCADYLSN